MEIRPARQVEGRLAGDAKKNPKTFYRYASGRCQQSIMNNRGESITILNMIGILNEISASHSTVESDGASLWRK